jgi:hypothetical protein
MRIRRPSWFEPLDSVGEWIGFLGGLVVAVAVIAFVVLLVKGIANSVTVSVRNDSRLTAAITGCNDGREFIGPGDVFQVEGLPDHDRFYCIVSFREGQEQCVVIPRVREIRGTIDLTQLIPVRRSSC